MNACRFKHADVASRLLERSVVLDPDLGRRIDRWQGRQAFVEFLIQHPGSHWSGGPTEGRETTPWEAFVIRQLTNALDGNDLPAFRRWLQDEPWVLHPSFVEVQIGVIERASWGQDREPFITALLEHDPALLRTEPPPPSSAIVFALGYGHEHLVPTLTRIWSLPDDLPHAAGTGNAAAVARWFDATGQAVLGSPAHTILPTRLESWLRGRATGGTCSCGGWRREAKEQSSVLARSPFPSSGAIIEP